MKMLQLCSSNLGRKISGVTVKRDQLYRISKQVTVTEKAVSWQLLVQTAKNIPHLLNLNSRKNQKGKNQQQQKSQQHHWQIFVLKAIQQAYEADFQQLSNTSAETLSSREMPFTQGFGQYHSLASKEGQRDFQIPNKCTFGKLKKNGQSVLFFSNLSHR